MSRITHDQAPSLPVRPQPDLSQLQQRDDAPIVVPVRQDGPVETHELPSRIGAAFSLPLISTMQHVLGKELKRKRVLLLADGPWLYAQHSSQPGIRWPTDVAMEITHADAVYAASHPDAQSAVTLSVIVEVWAD
jgi:hypothetical protein